MCEGLELMYVTDQQEPECALVSRPRYQGLRPVGRFSCASHVNGNEHSTQRPSAAMEESMHGSDPRDTGFALKQAVTRRIHTVLLRAMLEVTIHSFRVVPYGL
jgi:hypothetical protein